MSYLQPSILKASTKCEPDHTISVVERNLFRQMSVSNGMNRNLVASTSNLMIRRPHI